MNTYCQVHISIGSSDSKNKNLLAAQRFIKTNKYPKRIFKAAFPNGKYFKITKQPLYWISESNDILLDGWIYWASSNVTEQKIKETICGCEVSFNLTPIPSNLSIRQSP